MKHYYAIEQPNEDYFDYELYFNDTDANEQGMWIGGNRDLLDMGDESLINIGNRLDDLYADYLDACDPDDEDENGVPEDDRIELARNYFDCDALRGKIDADIANQLIGLARRHYDNDGDKYDTICEALTLTLGKPYKNGVLRGSCQGDWLRYICPEGVSEEHLKFIEAVLFATGTEYAVCTTPHESREDVDMQGSDIEYSYYYQWGDDELKAAIAKDLSYKDKIVKPEEVILVKVSGRHTYVEYDYEEV